MFYRKATVLFALLSGLLIGVMFAALAVTTAYSQMLAEGEGVEAGPAAVSAQVRFNNENWFTTPHPEPETMVVTDTGEVFGTTTTGIPFSQTNVENDAGIRVQKFVIQDHYHYIVEGEPVYSTAELSERLAAATQEREETPLGRLVSWLR